MMNEKTHKVKDILSATLIDYRLNSEGSYWERETSKFVSQPYPPFLYFPLGDHFEQQSFVGFRLARYRAGFRMDFDATSPEQLADAVAAHMGRPVSYGPVPVDGAKKAASMIADLLQKRALA
jgi:hypothetical protein